MIEAANQQGRISTKGETKVSYRIIYVKDVEFGALAHDFVATSDDDAREKIKDEIKKLKQKHGNDILIRRLQRVQKINDMEERVKEISF